MLSGQERKGNEATRCKWAYRWGPSRSTLETASKCQGSKPLASEDYSIDPVSEASQLYNYTIWNPTTW